MKRLKISFLVLVLNTCVAFAQSPDAINYQFLIRDSIGSPLMAKNISIKISILSDSINGETVYSETHDTISNDMGLVNLKIGKGDIIAGNFTEIPWRNGEFFLKQEADLLDGSGMELLACTQLVSVPYAIHSSSSNNLIMESRNGTLFNFTISNEGELNAVPAPPDCAPIAGFTCSSTVGPMPYTVSFTDTSLYQPTSWHWDFGDGLSSTEQNPSHKYWVEGWYTVSLTVYNGLTYDTATYENYIHVTGFCPSTVTDIDGNVYNTVLIDDYKCWMKENLRVTHYADGTPVPFVPETSDWAALSKYDSAYCYYYNNPASEYGVLYTWAAAKGDQSSNLIPSGIQGVCPEGWHLPSTEEWNELIDMFGGNSYAGGKLKETGLEHWNDPNTGATNESGFTALPGGYRDCNGGWFKREGEAAYFWSSYAMNNWTRYYFLENYTDNISSGSELFASGFSVRCMKDY